jgi:hypothetical protein
VIELLMILTRKQGKKLLILIILVRKRKEKNNIDVSELEKYPIIVTTHEGYKRFVELTV